MTPPVVLAVDGGNSKTDLALIRADGHVLAAVRGPQSSPHHLGGVDGAVRRLEDLLDQALGQAGLAARNGEPVADVAHVLLAGVDFPAEEAAVHDALVRERWSARTVVGNDTFAVLRTGTDRGWGVGITCGAGINCVGVSPDGRHVRFPALGIISGDWGGGYDLGQAALAAAARGEDGRGTRTVLERVVPQHFGLSTPLALTEAVHVGRIPMRRLVELAPLVLAEAEHDAEAGAIVDRLADEIVAFARAALTRLGLAGEPVDVVGGGGIFRARSPRLLRGVEAGLARIGPSISLVVGDAPPIVGAALLGLDELGALPEALLRVRGELSAAVDAAAGLVPARAGDRTH